MASDLIERRGQELMLSLLSTQREKALDIKYDDECAYDENEHMMNEHIMNEHDE